MFKVKGMSIKGELCLVYEYNGIMYAIAIDGTGLVATWPSKSK